MVINWRTVAMLLGPAVYGLGVMALIPAVFSLISRTHELIYFLIVSVSCFALGFGLRWLGRRQSLTSDATIRDLFGFTASLWIVATCISAFPFYMMLDELSFAASLFESASGLSTTGATAITGLDQQPRSLLLWRSILQYIGGVGFVMLAVAILPNVSLGGMNIFKTESTSFDSAAKFTPHVKTMALTLLGWYVTLTAACAACYMYGGLDWFTAVNAAMTTIATGGMMPCDAQMNEMGPCVHYAATFFMLLSSCPFLLTFAALVRGQLRALVSDEQVQGLLMLVLCLGLIVSASLVIFNDYDVERALRVGFFNVVSILSTSGFALEDFTAWNNLATLLFFIIMPLGACSGSSSGGIKTFRIQVCFSLFRTQIAKSVHPHLITYPMFNRRPIDSDTLRSLITYIVSYVILMFVSSLAAVVLGLGLTEAFSGTISCLSNIGPAMGPVLGPSGSYAGLSDTVHLLFAFDMIVGRLEILPVLLFLTRTFWK